MTATEMAEVLRQYYIEDTTRRRPEAVSRLKDAAAERCFVKTRLFRLALILMTLEHKQKEDARLAEVISNLQRLTYASANQDLPFAKALHAATTAIRQLISLTQDRQQEGPGKTPSWARDWLADIGVDEHNALRAATFALYWLDEIILASDIVDESQRKLDPPVFESGLKQVQFQTKPLKDICMAIVRAATNCRDTTKPLIEAPTEESRTEREIYIFYEFLYFFMHMAMRQAFASLSHAKIEFLQGYLRPVISSTAIDSYFAHWPDDLKQKMTAEFDKKLSEQDAEYSESARSIKTMMEFGLRPASSNPIEEALFMTIASNVANWATDNEDDSKVNDAVRQIATSEWSRMQIDRLIGKASSGNWEHLI
jgi:hypothetical protein